MQEMQVRSLVWEDPLEEEMESTPVFLLRESHGQRSMVGYSPWGRRESDTTERLNDSRKHDIGSEVEGTYLHMEQTTAGPKW